MVYVVVWISGLLFKCLMYKGGRDMMPGVSGHLVIQWLLLHGYHNDLSSNFVI